MTAPYVLTLGGLHLTFYGLSDPHAFDAWDQGWCHVKMICQEEGAHIKVTGSLLHLVDLKALLDCLTLLLITNEPIQTWETLEEHLMIRFEQNHLGHLTVTVHITPDPHRQQHTFYFELDQTYLLPLKSTLSQFIKDFDITKNDL